MVKKPRISLFYTIGALYGFADLPGNIIQGFTADYIRTQPRVWATDVINKFVRSITGYSIVWRNFDIMPPFRLYSSLLAAGLARKYFGKFLNPAIHKLPLIGEYLSA